MPLARSFDRRAGRSEPLVRRGAPWSALLVPLGIGLLAAALRLWAIDLAPFGYDEVDVLGRARSVINGAPTATGPLTSWGIPDPPGSVYLMAPPSLLPRPALAAAAWAALLNVAAVLLTWWLARRYFGPRVALAAALLYAVNPWAVYFSRRTWAEIIPLYTVVALWAALEVVCHRRSVWAAPFFVALALQVNTRILALVYAPAALLGLALFPRRWGWRWPLVGIALGTLISLPYLVYVAGHWSELAARLAEGNRGIDFDAQNSAPALLLWTAAGYGLLPANSRAAPWLDPLGWAGGLTLWVVAALLLGGLVMTARALMRRCQDAPALLLPALWLALPFLTLMAQSSSVYLHYLVALFPTAFLVMAFPLGALLGSRRSPLRLVGAATLILLCAVQLTTTGALYRVLAAYDPDETRAAPLELRQAAAALPREAADQLGTGERYGVELPLRFWLAVADATHTQAARLGLGDVLILAGATAPLTAERPAILDYLLRPRVEPRFLQADTLVFPLDRPALVLEAPDIDPADTLERFGPRLASIPIPSTNRVGRDYAHLTLVEGRPPEAWNTVPPFRNRAAFEGSIELLGFRVDRVIRTGDSLPVVTYWRLGPETTTAPVSVRLLDARGGSLTQAEPLGGSALTGTSGGRILVRRQELVLPAQAPVGDYQLEAIVVGQGGSLVPRTGGRGVSESLVTIRVSPR